MRDLNRIKPFCEELSALWENHPDLRFGQIMHNLEGYCQWEKKKDMLYIEDDELMEIIREQLRA